MTQNMKFFFRPIKNDRIKTHTLFYTPKTKKRPPPPFDFVKWTIHIIITLSIRRHHMAFIIDCKRQRKNE